MTTIAAAMFDSQELVKEARLLQIIENSLGLRLSHIDLAYFRHIGMPYTRIGIRNFLYRPETCLMWLNVRHITPNIFTNFKEVA